MLGAGIRALPTSEDPTADRVEAGVLVFRQFAVEHRSLFGSRSNTATAPQASGGRTSEQPSKQHSGLHQRIARLGPTDRFADPAVSEAAIEFHALCEGLAALELRGLLPTGNEERLWRHALTALVSGLNGPPSREHQV